MQVTNNRFFHQVDMFTSPTKRNSKQQKGKVIQIKTQNNLQKTGKVFHKQINTFHNSGLIIPLNNESPSPLKRFIYSKNIFNKNDVKTFKLSPNKISSYSPVQQKTSLPIVNDNSGFSQHLVNDYYNFYPNPKISTASCHCIKGYGSNTYRGLVRNYNEDRLAISLGMKCPSDCSVKWPKDLNVSFFAIYDGHAGNKCSEYLKNNLHNFILKDTNFPSNPVKALQNGFDNAEKAYMNNNYKNKSIFDYSGSCALVALFVNNVCYIANVGDSRGIYSYNSGNECFQLTRDHKPNDTIEKQRITKEGGSIYRTTAIGVQNLPWRVLPGKLSVSRAFGDLEAKILLYGGNPNVLISSPSITTIELDDKSDFMILGCDGIYDKLSNEEIITMAWSMKKKNAEVTNIHQHCALVTDAIMKYSLKRYTVDNISCIFISFDNFMKKMQDSSFIYPQNRKYNVVHIVNMQEGTPNNNPNEDKTINNNNSHVMHLKNSSAISFLPNII